MKGLQASLEAFLLEHPILMQCDFDRALLALLNIVFIGGALYFAFGRYNASGAETDLSWSLLPGKLFRLSWCVAPVALAVVSYDIWRNPSQSNLSYPLLEWSLALLWLTLFLGTYLVLALQHWKLKRETKASRCASSA